MVVPVDRELGTGFLELLEEPRILLDNPSRRRERRLHPERLEVADASADSLLPLAGSGTVTFDDGAQALAKVGRAATGLERARPLYVGPDDGCMRQSYWSEGLARVLTRDGVAVLR
jgi:hypothetical protein